MFPKMFGFEKLYKLLDKYIRRWHSRKKLYWNFAKIYLQHFYFSMKKTACSANISKKHFCNTSWNIHKCLIQVSHDKKWMRSSLVVRASGCQCQNRNSTVLDSIPTSSDTVESEGRQIKQCWIQYIEEKKSKKIPLLKKIIKHGGKYLET